MNTKLPRISRVDQVHDAILKRILQSEWEFGEKIPPEAELAEFYGVNKLTVRMALQKLNVMGLLETRVGEGSFVKKFNMAGYFHELNQMGLLSESDEEISDFRSILQIGNIILSFKQDPAVLNEKLRQLEEVYENMCEALNEDDGNRFIECDLLFHKLLNNLSDNKMMINIAQTTEQLIQDYTKKSARRSLAAGRKKELIDFHKTIIDAIKNRDIYLFIANENKSIFQNTKTSQDEET